MIIRKSNQIQKEKLSAGKNTFRQILISSNEAPNFALRKFIIEPGGSMPMHTNLVEHEQYILKGSAEITIDSKIFIVEKDNIVFIPANVPHSYKTIGDEPFEFLCIVPNKEDKITVV
jgi:quercetin dioxygenase-like cupin family protein